MPPAAAPALAGVLTGGHVPVKVDYNRTASQSQKQSQPMDQGPNPGRRQVSALLGHNCPIFEVFGFFRNNITQLLHGSNLSVAPSASPS
jgi:hypothetical protein